MSTACFPRRVACLLVGVVWLSPAALAAQPTAIAVMRTDGSQLRQVAAIEGYNDFTCPRWSHDGKRIVFAAKGGSNANRGLFVVNSDGTGLVQIGQHNLPDWSPDDKQIAFQHDLGNNLPAEIWVQNLDGQGRVRITTGTTARWSPDGSRLAVVDGQQVRVIDLATGDETPLFDDLPDDVLNGLAWSPDGQRLAVAIRPAAGAARQLVLVSAQGAKHGLSVRLKTTNLGGGLSFSPDGKQLAYASDYRIQIIEVDGHGPSRPVPLAKGLHRNPDWSPDGQWIVFATDRVGPASPPPPKGAPQDAQLNELGRHAKGSIVYGLAYTPDGRKLVMGGDPESEGLAVLDLNTGQSKSLGGQGISVAMFPDGRHVATSWLSPAVQIVDIESGEIIREMQHGATIRALAVSKDGSRVVTGGLDKRLTVWDAATAEPVCAFQQHGDWIIRAVFSPSGKEVISTSYDKTVRIWDAQSGKQRIAIAQPETPWGLAVSPDGRHVFTGSGGPLQGSPTALVILPGDDNTLRMWDTTTGAAVREMRGHTHAVYSIDVSPDGRRVVTGSWDGSVRLWDLETGKALASVADHQGAVMRVAFAPDGKSVAAGGGVARLANDTVDYPDEQVRFYRVLEK